MQTKKRIIDLIEAKAKTFTDVSDRIWEFAETRFSLAQSADALCAVLAQEGFAVERPVAEMRDAFVATYGKGKPVIGILAEYDALPMLSQVAGLSEEKMLEKNGAGHGCGHNALGAGALAGAIGIKDYMQEKNITGTIKFYGCPAEESGSGKAFMARAGVFAGLDAILTWHPMTETRIWGSSSLANYQVYFEFKGLSAHAAAAPQHGRSALDAAELMNVGVNYLREHIIQEARIHYAYIDAGGQFPNVVQPHTKLLYFIRAPKSLQVKEIFDRVVKVAEGAAHMTETRMEILWDSACAEYVVNDKLARIMYANMEELGDIEYTDEELAFAATYTDTFGAESKKSAKMLVKNAFDGAGEEKIEQLLKKPIIGALFPYMLTDAAMPGSTDVGDASWQAPTVQLTATCYPFAAVAHSWQYVACGKSSLAHKGLLYAGKTIAMTALDLLENPQLLKEANEEFRQRLQGEIYNCPIPDSVKPQ